MALRLVVELSGRATIEMIADLDKSVDEVARSKVVG